MQVEHRDKGTQYNAYYIRCPIYSLISCIDKGYGDGWSDSLGCPGTTLPDTWFA